MMTQLPQLSTRLRTFRCVVCRILGWLGLFLLSTIGYASTVDHFNASTTACSTSTSDDVRVVQVIYESDASLVPCKVMYEKGGVWDELATARNTVGFCEKTERQVVRNLVKGGWRCEHRLSGSGVASDKTLVLDLFSDQHHSAAATSEQPVAHALGSSPHTRRQLTVIFNEKYRQAIQKQLASDLQRELGVELQVDVDLEAEFNLVDPSAMAAVSTSQAHTTNFPVALSMLRYALVSQTVDTEQQAHKLTAEFKRLYPRVATRIARYGTGSAALYRVVLGTTDTREDLTDSLQLLDASVQAHFYSIDNFGYDAPIVYVPDDWPRYIIALCLAEGHATVGELAACTDFVLDVNTLLSCLSGGACVPVSANDSQIMSANPDVDLRKAMKSNNPVALARSILKDNVERCGSMPEDSEAQLAECTALALLDDKQRLVVECHKRSQSVSQMLDCVGGAELSAVVSLYERCAVSRIANLQCLLEMTDNELVIRTSTCLEEETPGAIAQCVILADINVDEQQIFSCLKQSTSVNTRVSCIASQQLEPSQTALLECAEGSPSIGNFGICAARALRTGTDAQWLAASCLINNNLSSVQLPSCAGGRMAGSELIDCLAEGVSLFSCHDSDTILTDIVNNTLDSYIATGEVDHEIAAFRNELYAAEGGDLSAVLSDSTINQWLKTTESDNKSALRTRNGQSSGFKRFGVDK